jgi:hypothetical protein
MTSCVDGTRSGTVYDMSTPSTAPATLTTERAILLDRINCLTMFDETGRDCEEAMALMTRHSVTAAECNARRTGGNRPTYRPVIR